MTYAPINGLDMYYEIHGTGQPVVLLHGALSGVETSFGPMVPLLARTRRVIAVEFQAHGRTADIDRPLSIAQLAEDVVALLRHLGIDRADVFGYSMGAEVALHLVTEHPEVVRKAVLASVAYDLKGLHPGTLDGIGDLRPEHLFGTPFHSEYVKVAPRPEDFPTLLAKVTDLDSRLPEWPADAIRAITTPTLLIAGDADLVRPEHVVEMFRLLGGGVNGDLAEMPPVRLAVLPGTSHVGVTHRGDWVAPMVDDFLGP